MYKMLVMMNIFVFAGMGCAMIPSSTTNGTPTMATNRSVPAIQNVSANGQVKVSEIPSSTIDSKSITNGQPDPAKDSLPTVYHSLGPTSGLSGATNALPKTKQANVVTNSPTPGKVIYVSHLCKNKFFKPTFRSSLADKFPCAIRIYNSSPMVGQGLYEYENLIFVVVEFDVEAEGIKYPEGTAMLRYVAILRKYFPRLPQAFNLQSRVVEKNHDEDTNIYRYAVVYRLADIQKLLRNK